MEEPLTEELLDELLSASDPQSFFESQEVRPVSRTSRGRSRADRASKNPLRARARLLFVKALAGKLPVARETAHGVVDVAVLGLIGEALSARRSTKRSICGMYFVARGSCVGARHPSASMSSCMARANSSVSSSVVTPRSAARRMILSSTSVMLRTKVTL